MMTGNDAADMARRTHHFFKNVIQSFTTEHQDFKPAEGSMTAAQQIRHVAMTAKWFQEGAFGAGFDTNFETMESEIRKPTTLEQAVRELDENYGNLIACLEGLTPEELMAPLADNPFFGNAPKIAIISADADHTAHHRGALSVYLRLLGIKPNMPYMDPPTSEQP